MNPRRILLTLLLALLAAPLAAQSSPPLRDDISADSLLAEANRHIGVPYHYSGKTPKGFDCAGFVRYVYGRFGVSLPASSRDQYPQGQPVKVDELLPGDLVFFGGRMRTHTIGHVGIVTAAASNGYSFIHAASTGVRISLSSEDYYAKRYLGACRILAPSAPSPPPAPAPQPAGQPQPPPEPEPLPPPDTVFSIAMVGDIMLGTDFPKPMLPLHGGRQLFSDAAPILSAADIAIGNLEGVFCDTIPQCRKKEGQYSYAFRTPPEYAQLLQQAGFDFLSLANNHSYDFGLAGTRQTMARLDSLGIRYAGIRDICDIALLRIDSTTFGFASFGHNSHTPRLTDSAAVRRILEPLRYACDILVVSFHGGGEGHAFRHLPDSTERYLDENRGHLRRFAHLCVDLGADIVHGHGPHVCRAMEVYRGRLIAYSLGNFCTPVGINLQGYAAHAPIVTARIGRSGALVDGRIHSFLQPYRKGPRPDPENTAAKNIRSLTFDDFDDPHIAIDDDGFFRPTDETVENQ